VDCWFSLSLLFVNNYNIIWHECDRKRVTRVSLLANSARGTVCSVGSAERLLAAVLYYPLFHHEQPALAAEWS